MSESEKTKTVAASRLEINSLMRPQHANFAGNVHGGVILGMMDEAAYLCASRYAEAYCVTAALDHVDFASAIRVGDMVTIRASVNAVGTTSMQIGLQVVAEDPQKPGTSRRTNRSFFTMVAVSEAGSPLPVPALICETEEDHKWRCEAELRRELRANFNEELTQGRCRIDAEGAA